MGSHSHVEGPFPSWQARVSLSDACLSRQATVFLSTGDAGRDGRPEAGDSEGTNGRVSGLQTRSAVVATS